MKTLFKGGTIYDGSGRRPFKGDVLIEGDRIVRIGENIKSKADRIIDVSGKQICPGFIDAHSHKISSAGFALCHVADGLLHEFALGQYAYHQHSVFNKADSTVL